MKSRILSGWRLSWRKSSKKPIKRIGTRQADIKLTLHVDVARFIAIEAVEIQPERTRDILDGRHRSHFAQRAQWTPESPSGRVACRGETNRVSWRLYRVK